MALMFQTCVARLGDSGHLARAPQFLKCRCHCQIRATHTPVQVMQHFPIVISGRNSIGGRQKFRCQVINCNSFDSGNNDLQIHSAKQDNKSSSLGGGITTLLKNASATLPFAVVASTLLAFVHPPSFTFFTTRYYAPALGFLMFAVGINLRMEDFLHALEEPSIIALGYGAQFIVKPLLGLLFATIATTVLHLPAAIGSGLMLMSCVSGAQLSNYATFLVEPGMASLSIIMTALSTVTAALVTPALTLLLLGRRLPVDVAGMMTSITQIVVVPVAGGLFLNKFGGPAAAWLKVLLPFCSVLVTCCCVGAPLAMNIKALQSVLGFRIFLAILGFHAVAFLVGYQLTKLAFPSAQNLRGLARTISFETGMQSSLLGLTLANNFFHDTLVGLPSAISVVVMSLLGFGLTIIWGGKNNGISK